MLTGDDGTGDPRARAERRHPPVAQPPRSPDARGDRRGGGGGDRAGCVHRAQPQRRADVHHRRGPRRRAVPRRVGTCSRAPPRCASLPDHGRRSAGYTGAAALGARRAARPDRRDDAGRSRLGQSRPHQRRERSGTGRGRAVPQLLRRRRPHVHPHGGARGGAQHLGVRAGLPAHRADLASRRTGRRARSSSCTSAGSWSSGCRRQRPPSTRTSSCWSRRACRGPWRCSAGTSSPVAWGNGRSSVAGTSESFWRTGQVPASRATSISSGRRSP